MMTSFYQVYRLWSSTFRIFTFAYVYLLVIIQYSLMIHLFGIDGLCISYIGKACHWVSSEKKFQREAIPCDSQKHVRCHSFLIHTQSQCDIYLTKTLKCVKHQKAVFSNNALLRAQKCSFARDCLDVSTYLAIQVCQQFLNYCLKLKGEVADTQKRQLSQSEQTTIFMENPRISFFVCSLFHSARVDMDATCWPCVAVLC